MSKQPSISYKDVGVDIDADSVTASRRTLARFAPGATARFDVVSVFDMMAPRMPTVADAWALRLAAWPECRTA